MLLLLLLHILRRLPISNPTYVCNRRVGDVVVVVVVGRRIWKKSVERRDEWWYFLQFRYRSLRLRYCCSCSCWYRISAFSSRSSSSLHYNALSSPPFAPPAQQYLWHGKSNITSVYSTVLPFFSKGNKIVVAPAAAGESSVSKVFLSCCYCCRHCQEFPNSHHHRPCWRRLRRNRNRFVPRVGVSSWRSRRLSR